MFNGEQLALKHMWLVQSQNEFQEHVDEYLKNKDNSLEDRWKVWTKYSQKEDKTWIQHFNDFEGFDDWINDGEWLGRGSTINLEHMVESFHGFLESENILEDSEEYNSKMDSFKVYLMKENLGSYKFDW